MAKIGVIGLGNMGLPMAGNLVKKGHEVKASTSCADNLARAASRGVTRRRSAEDAATDVDVVVTMLPAGKDTLAVWGGGPAAGGIARHPASSTPPPSTSPRRAPRTSWPPTPRCSRSTRRCRAASAARRRRTLTFMCGGSTEAFEKAKPILEAMGKRVVHCGEAGAGQAAKICNNMMLGISMIGVCEAFVLAEKLGLSHQALFDVASTSSGQCWSLDELLPGAGTGARAAVQQQLQGRASPRP